MNQNGRFDGRLYGRFREQTSRLASPVFIRVSEQNGRLGGLMSGEAEGEDADFYVAGLY